MQGLTHAQVAERLRASRIYLAFTHQEGFGLPAAEAMACGNYVIGNHGQAGREFFDSAFSMPIETGNMLGFARAVEAAVENERSGRRVPRARPQSLAIHSLRIYAGTGGARRRAIVRLSLGSGGHARGGRRMTLLSIRQR